MSTDNKNPLEKDLEINDSNIFEDFSSDKALKDDLDNYKKQESRDIYDYIKLSSNIFKYINLALFLFLTITFLYIFIQKNENLSNSTLLDPICFLIA